MRSRAYRYFSSSRMEARNERGSRLGGVDSGRRARLRERSVGGCSYYFAVPRLPSRDADVKYTAYGKLSFPPPPNSRAVDVGISRRVILRFYTRIISRYARRARRALRAVSYLSGIFESYTR